MASRLPPVSGTNKWLRVSSKQPATSLITKTSEASGLQTGTMAATRGLPTQMDATSAASEGKKRGNSEKKMPRVLEMCGVNTISHIVDRFGTYEAVTRAMKDAGLERCSLIFGIDYTSSNLFQVLFSHRTAVKFITVQSVEHNTIYNASSPIIPYFLLRATILVPYPGLFRAKNHLAGIACTASKRASASTPTSRWSHISEKRSKSLTTTASSRHSDSVTGIHEIAACSLWRCVHFAVLVHV